MAIQEDLQKLQPLVRRIRFKGTTPTDLPTLHLTRNPPRKEYKVRTQNSQLLHEQQLLVHDPRQQLKTVCRERNWKTYLATHPEWDAWNKTADAEIWSRIWKHSKSKRWHKLTWIKTTSPFLRQQRQGNEVSSCRVCGQANTQPDLEHILKVCEVNEITRQTFYINIAKLNITVQQRQDAHDLNPKLVPSLVDTARHPTLGLDTDILVIETYITMYSMWKHYHTIYKETTETILEAETICNNNNNNANNNNNTNNTT
jgi:hypothetical protein